MTILAARDIGISFGGVKAIDGVSFAVSPGQILSIIGPNGAGKTTLFNIVSGVYERDQGQVELSGEDVTGLTPDKLATRGLSRTFQNLQIMRGSSELVPMPSPSVPRISEYRHGRRFCSAASSRHCWPILSAARS